MLTGTCYSYKTSLALHKLVHWPLDNRWDLKKGRINNCFKNEMKGTITQVSDVKRRLMKSESKFSFKNFTKSR